MTRRGLENERVRVFLSMTTAGASKAEAFAYIDLIHPIESEWRLRYSEGHANRL